MKQTYYCYYATKLFSYFSVERLVISTTKNDEELAASKFQQVPRKSSLFFLLRASHLKMICVKCRKENVSITS